MPLSPHARVALGTAVLVAVVGASFSATHGGAQPTTLVAVDAGARIPEAGVIGLRQARGRWSRDAELATTDPTPTPTPAPAPPPAPPPPPPPPPPPTAGGLQILAGAPGVFGDASAGRSGVPAMQDATGILVDADTRQILWENNPHQSRPPASTAKIVSSLVALNNFSPSKVISITADALNQASDETRMGLQPGEQYKVEDLLSGMLTVSANDAATAMAVDTVGMGNFVAAMNAQMQALGLHDSHFVTPVGLDDPQQYTSAYDLAAVALTDWARFPVFRNIVWRGVVNLPQTATHPAYHLQNLNRLLQFYPYAVGVKPGWTGNAGACLVGMAVRNGHRLIAVVMNDPVLYTDETHLFQWGFAQYGIPPVPGLP